MAALIDSVMQVSSTQKVSVSGTSAATTNTIGGERTWAVVRLLSTTDCHVAFAASPTATTNNMLLKANMPEYFKMNSGDKVAAIQSSASGTLYVTHMV